MLQGVSRSYDTGARVTSTGGRWAGRGHGRQAEPEYRFGRAETLELQSSADVRQNSKGQEQGKFIGRPIRPKSDKAG